ncbi:MAG: hypothetical protein ACFCUQ_21545 [Kiloniellales bacterium]
MLTSEHFDMVEAIRRQNVAEADRLAHDHTRQFYDRFMNFLKAQYHDDFSFEVFSGSQEPVRSDRELLEIS